MKPLNDAVVALWNDPEPMLDMWESSKEKQEHEVLVASLVGAPDSVADLGCGAGRMFAAIMDYYGLLWYYGFDASTAMIQEARRNYGHLDNAKFSVVDVFEYSSDKAYEVVVMLDVAQHQRDPIGSIIRMLQLWQAERYIFSLLVGSEREELSMSVVVSFVEFMELLEELEGYEVSIDRVGEEGFAWILVQCDGCLR